MTVLEVYYPVPKTLGCDTYKIGLSLGEAGNPSVCVCLFLVFLLLYKSLFNVELYS
jgi:hypothetical protein